MAADTPPSNTPPGDSADTGRGTVLCRLDDLADPGGRGFQLGTREALFVIRSGGRVFGYVNVCPHQGLALDWKPDVFLSVDKRTIQCANHGARFAIETGKCIAGPCVGGALKPVRLRLADGAVTLDE